MTLNHLFEQETLDLDPALTPDARAHRGGSGEHGRDIGEPQDHGAGLGLVRQCIADSLQGEGRRQSLRGLRQSVEPGHPAPGRRQPISAEPGLTRHLIDDTAGGVLLRHADPAASHRAWPSRGRVKSRRSAQSPQKVVEALQRQQAQVHRVPPHHLRHQFRIDAGHGPGNARRRRRRRQGPDHRGNHLVIDSRIVLRGWSMTRAAASKPPPAAPPRTSASGLFPGPSSPP